MHRPQPKGFFLYNKNIQPSDTSFLIFSYQRHLLGCYELIADAPSEALSGTFVYYLSDKQNKLDPFSPPCQNENHAFLVNVS